jgi:hypothetical protein
MCDETFTLTEVCNLYTLSSLRTCFGAATRLLTAEGGLVEERAQSENFCCISWYSLKLKAAEKNA